MENNRIRFDKARFTVLTESLIRMEYSVSGEFEDRPTQIVQNRNFPSVRYERLEKNNSLKLFTDSVTISYTGGPFTQSSLSVELKFDFPGSANLWHFGDSAGGNLGGTVRTLDAVDGAIKLDDGIMSRHGFTILRDDSLALTTSGTIAGKSVSSMDVYLFAYGRDYRRALKDFYKLTGPTPLLPRFALGNWWSRYYEYSEESYLALMDRFSEKNVPLSVAVIDMDWHRVADVPQRFGNGWTGYSWNKNLFPDPKRFLAELKKRRLKVALNDHPADGVRAFEEHYPAIAKRLNLNTELEESAKFDLDNADFREGFFEDIHRPLEEEGVDFWWLDWQQGTVSSSGADPLWLLNHFQYQDAQKKAKNNILLSRYAGPGSHRYPIGFSGDTVISWESLDFQPYFTSTATNIGYTWWSHDIGGHWKGKKDPELSLRWLQYGVFSPINRLHSSKSEFTRKEPWHFDKIVEEAMENFLRLRHALIPYLYSANIKTAREGQALVEPMYYAYPLSEEAYHYKNQYLFGGEMIVAPITQKMDSDLKTGAVDVWLPEGLWYDFFTGQRYEGNVEIKVFREMAQIPVFVKAGAIIPLDKNPLAKEDIPSEIIWKIFPGAAGTYSLLEDDNETTVTFDGKVIALTEKASSARRHTLIFAGREVAASLTGNFEWDMTACDDQFNWSFEKQLLRFLDNAEIAYDEKNFILGKLSQITDFNKQMAFLMQLKNRAVREALFELLYCKNNVK